MFSAYVRKRMAAYRVSCLASWTIGQTLTYPSKNIVYSILAAFSILHTYPSSTTITRTMSTQLPPRQLSADDPNELRILVWGLTIAGKSKLIEQCGATANYIDEYGRHVVKEPKVGGGVNSGISYTRRPDPTVTDHNRRQRPRRSYLMFFSTS